MYRQLVLLAFVGFAFAAPDNSQRPNERGIDGRIIGGNDALITDHPWQVSVEFYRGHSCGGVIIFENYVITAAHCTAGALPEMFSIRANTTFMEHNGTDVKVKTINLHPQYTKIADPFVIAYDYDICLLELETPLTFGVGIEAIKLPEEGQILPAGTVVTFSGWGITYPWGITLSDNLQAINITSYSFEDCQGVYEELFNDTMMCAGVLSGKQFPSAGDAGGPLETDKILWGIYSWNKGCAEKEYPSVFTNITAVLPFIKEITGL